VHAINLAPKKDFHFFHCFCCWEKLSEVFFPLFLIYVVNIWNQEKTAKLFLPRKRQNKALYNYTTVSLFLSRAAQRISNSTNTRTRAEASMERGGFCGVLQRFPPPVPPALTRRLANRENMGFGKVSIHALLRPCVKYRLEKAHFRISNVTENK
jgi:hypothetical protein